MKILACGLLSAMLLAGTAAALEPISQPIATSGYTYYAIRADGALLAWGDSFHGAVGPADQDPLPWEEANVLLENARYVDAGFAMAAAIDEDGTLWGWGGHAGRTFGEKEPYRLLEDVVSVSVMDATCAALRADGTVWTWGARSGRSLAEHGDDPFYPPTQVLDHAVKLCDDLAVLEDGTLVQLLMDGETAAIRPLLEHVADVRVAYGSDDALLVLALDGSLWWVPCTTAEEEETDFAVYLLGQPEKLLEQVSWFSPGLAVTADGTLWGWGHQRPAMLRDGGADPADPYGWKHYDDVVKIMDGVISAVACDDRTLAVLEDGSLWQLPSAREAVELAKRGDTSRSGPTVPEKLLDQVLLPSPAPAWQEDAPAPAVVEAASSEVWEARPAPAAESEPAALEEAPAPELKPAREQNSLELGVLAASLAAMALATWIRGRKN